MINDIKLCMYQTTHPWIRCDTRSTVKWSKTSLNSGFSFSLIGCRTKAKEISLPNYLTIARGRTDGFMPF